MAFNDVSDSLGGTTSHDGRKERNDADGFVIHFVHIPTGETCHFKAFLTAFDDQYESQWNEEEVFGRMDPISTYKRTRRRIRLGWDIPSASEDEAILNLSESEKLLNMLYPVFEERLAADFVNGGTLGPLTQPSKDQRVVGTMVAPPLFKIKFSNLIMDSKTGRVSSGAAKSGLVGTIAGLSYRPDIEQGFFGGFTGNEDTRQILPGALIPQTISFDIDFVVHHTHGLGYSRSKILGEPKTPGGETARTARRGGGFPYRSDKILKSRQ